MSSGKGKGRGRGCRNLQRGIPSPQVGHQRDQATRCVGDRVPSTEPRSPPEFFNTSSSAEEVARDEPGPSASTPLKEKKRLRNVHPEKVLGIEFRHERSVSPTLPKRPGLGNLGRPIKLISNCFSINVPSGSVYHYDVEIVRKERNSEAAEDKNDKKYRCLNTKKNRKIISLLIDTHYHFIGSYPAYDGKKNLYTRKELDARFPLKCEVILPHECTDDPHECTDDPHECTDDPHGSRHDTFEVTIKKVKKENTVSCAINLDSIHALFEGRTSEVPSEAVMAIETILRLGPCLRLTPIGRSFFYPPETLHPLGGGLEIWFGYHQSVRLGEWGPMVNLDATATTFWQEGPVLNYIADSMNTVVEDLRRIPVIHDAVIRRISNKLKGKEIQVTHLRYPKKCSILKLDTRTANEIPFSVTVGNRTETKTVASYFKERYKIILDFPNLPCLRIAHKTQEIYFPVEVCNFTPGQHSKVRLSDKQKAEMIKFTSDPPKQRFQQIDKIVRNADFNHDKCAQEFGLQVSRNPLKLEGRVLNSSGLLYRNENGSRRIIRPRDGSWNLRDTQFLDAASVSKWALLSFSTIPHEFLDIFSKLFLKFGKKLGIDIERPESIEKLNASRSIDEFLLRMKQRNVKLVVIVLPSVYESDTYSKIKKASETAIGLITQCIKGDTIKQIVNGRGGPQIVSNLWLKVNAKMGGENNTLLTGEIPAIFNDHPVIVIGADVNHPDPSPDRKPSLAACVGSLNNIPSRYAVSIRAQINENEKKKAIEIILDLASMVKELLLAFYRHTKKKPEKIIVYRDGVSEGQFSDVKTHEVASIRKACKMLQHEGYEPGITFITVQKRHHVRFMPEDMRDGVGKQKNVPPGTVVDTVVTHPVNWDFFLCSQLGLQGTSRPSHYLVIEDDNKLTANDLQKLTFHLCHMCVRCTKSISIPAPVAYADRVAYRARRHLEATIGTGDESSSNSDRSHNVSSSLPQEVIEAIKVTDDLKDSMYFV